ncbi:MAG TPA: hypothetical protein VLX85_12835 [Stellaceae bacterium]|nr:hypothetical protein [Stellaceae bacterium]
MPIARAISAQLENASWIRRMFEIGIQMRKERGAENVFDFSIGNPDVEPPEPVIEALRRVATENRPRSHGYMPNAGFPEVRARIAAIATQLGATIDHETAPERLDLIDVPDPRSAARAFLRMRGSPVSPLPP